MGKLELGLGELEKRQIYCGDTWLYQVRLHKTLINCLDKKTASNLVSLLLTGGHSICHTEGE